jgi:transcriptional regulator with XRE-family HTH domain
MLDDLISVVAANLRRLRTEQGRTLSELARASGIAKATLSALEAGKGNPTIETLSSLATALGIPFGDLLAGGAPEPVHVVHGGEGTTVPGTHNDLRLIVRLPGNPPIELYEARFPARSKRSAGAHGPGTREHVVLFQGALRTGPVDRAVDLRAGDYAGFAGDEMHLYEAGPRGARALLIMQWATQP